MVVEKWNIAQGFLFYVQPVTLGNHFLPYQGTQVLVYPKNSPSRASFCPPEKTEGLIASFTVNGHKDVVFNWLSPPLCGWSGYPCTIDFRPYTAAVGIHKPNLPIRDIGVRLSGQPKRLKPFRLKTGWF